jgi:arylsulfatase A-like enzyme
VMKLAMRIAPWQLFRVRDYLPPYAIVPFGMLVDEAEELLATHDATRPLFLYMQPVDPHGPYQAPLRYVPAGATFSSADYVSYWKLKTGVQVRPRQLESLIALYDGAVTYTDAELGRLLAILRKTGLYDQALIVVTADHGEQFFDHGLWRHSNSAFEPLVHIPLVIKYPGQHTGTVVRESVGGIDIMPTVLRTLGEGCASCEGRPLQTVGAQNAGDPPPLFTYLMGKEELRPMIRSVTAHGWKLIQTRKPNEASDRLFNIASDPGEQDDVLVQHNDIAAYLAGLLDSYEAKAGPTLVAQAINLKPAETERLRALGYVQ